MKRFSLASTRAKVIAALALLGVLGVGAIVFAVVRQSSLPAVELTTVTRARLTSSVTAVADIEAATRHVTTLTPAVKVVDVLVEEGQRVSAGDTLVVLDTSEYQSQLEQQGITLDDAQSTLEHMAGPSSRMDRATAEGAVAQARIALDGARERLDAARDHLADVPGLTDNALRQADVAVTAAQSNRDAAEENLESVIDLNGDEIRQAGLAVDAARIAVDRAQSDLDDLKDRLKAGLITRETFDAQHPALHLALDVARNALASAEVALSSTRTLADAEEARARRAVDDAETSVEGAETAREAVSLQGNTTRQTAQQAVTDAEQAVRSAEQTLATAQRAATYAGQSSTERANNQRSQIALLDANIDYLWDKVDQGSLRASVDGVVSRVDAEEGQFPEVGDLIVVEGSAGYVAGLEVSQPDSVGIRAGQRATVTLKGLGTEYRATVTEVAPVAEVSATSADAAPKVRVRASVLDPDETIKVGFEADVEVFLDDVPDALQLPPEAIVREPGTGRTYVLTVDDANRVARVFVRTGVEGDASVEVLEGLVEGQDVIIDPDPALGEGAQVRITRGGR